MPTNRLSNVEREALAHVNVNPLGRFDRAATGEELMAIFGNSDTAGFHNSIFRGKSLGSTITAEQWAAIKIRNGNDYLTDAEIIYGYVFEYVPGDVNGNGKIDSQDYAMTKRAFLKTFTLSAEQLARADVNRNGNADSKDYAMIKRHFLRTYVIPGAEGR